MSTWRRLGWFLVTIVVSCGVFLPIVQVSAQQARQPVRGVGASEPTVGGFIRGSIEGLYDTVTGQESTGDAAAARGAWGDMARDPVGTAREEYTGIARQALGVTGAGSILDALTARLVGFIAFVMGLIVAFLGKIILLLVNVLLGFLSYNGFATAPPVVIGWRMVRDLANMFFIVILILASYATILGWRTNELHVKSILPKVLLAAVLVNFSKTIVALLIDASQIVMLTFVDAFGAIGAGNFTNALHLPLIQGASYGQQLQNSVSSSAATVAQNGAGQVILDVVLAAGFQIFLLIVAIGVMLMMVIFVVARIVGLWMLLIFSPMPFLASALPGTMKKVLGGQVEKFWGRLSGLLTGGPIMAFWLWLTFATLSAQGADERLGLFENTQAADIGNTFGMVQNGASMFITAIGNAQGLGSYLVAIAMMMMGLEAAMDAAGAVGGSAGGLMKKIGNKSLDWGQRAALFAAGGGAVAGAGLALRGGKAVGGAALGAFDRRYDVRGKLAAAARRVPFASQNKWLRDQQYFNKNEEAKRQSEYEKIMNDPKLSDAQKAFEMKKIGRNEFWTGDRAGTKAVQSVLANDAIKKGTNEKAFDDELKARKDGAKDAIKAATGDAVVAKRVSDRAAKQESNRLRLEELEKGKAALSDVGKTEKEREANEEMRKKFDEEMKKIRSESPHLVTDDAEYKKQMASVRENYSKLSDDAKGNFDVLKNVAYDGAFNTAADGKVTVGDKAAIARTRKRLQGKDRENFDAMVKFVQESNGGISAAQMRNLSVERDAQDKVRIFETNTTRDANGNLVGATGSYQTSYAQQQAINDVTTNVRSDNAVVIDPVTGNNVGWMQKDDLGAIADSSTRRRLTTAAKTASVSQVVNSAPAGADAAGNSYRDAAARGISAQTGSSIQAATTYLDQQRTFTDQSGATVTKTNGEILQMGSRAPAGTRDLVNAEYQERVREVLPVLDGVDELNQGQQIQFMADMGAANVGQALDTRLMSDPSQLETVRKVKAVVSENAPAVNQWFAEGYAKDKGQMDQYAQYRAREQWKAANQGTVQNMDAMSAMTAAQRDTFIEGMAAPKDQAHETWKQSNPAEVQSMEQLRAMSDTDRDAFIRGMSGNPGEARAAKAKYESYINKEEAEVARQRSISEARAAYNDYVTKEANQSAIKAGNRNWDHGYAEYSKYANAAAVIDQFKRNPGKNSGATRARGTGGAGGGNPRPRRQRP